MNEAKKKRGLLPDIPVNVKTLYRPFKRCFKHPTNTVTKWIWNVIKYGIYQKTEISVHSDSKPSGGSRNLRYASIKGCCGLQKNGYLR